MILIGNLFTNLTFYLFWLLSTFLLFDLYIWKQKEWQKENQKNFFFAFVAMKNQYIYMKKKLKLKFNHWRGKKFGQPELILPEWIECIKLYRVFVLCWSVVFFFMLSHSVSNGENLLFFFLNFIPWFNIDEIFGCSMLLQCYSNNTATSSFFFRYFHKQFFMCVCVYIFNIFWYCIHLYIQDPKKFHFFSVFRYNNNSNNCVFRVDSLNFTTGGIEFHLVHHYQRFDVRHRHQHPHHRHRRHSHSHQLSMFLLVSH